MPLGAAVQVAGDISNSLINQAFAEHNRKRNFYWNEKAADSADQRQRKQYQDLYSPQAMMDQYAAAGLSPSMMMSGGQSAVGGTPQGAQGGINGPYPSGKIIDPLTIAQIENIKADTKKKEAETINIGADTELKGQEIIDLIASTKNKGVEHRILTAQAELEEANAEVTAQTIQAKINQAYYNSEKAAAESRSAVVKAELDEATFDVAYQLAYANLNNKLSDTALKKSEIQVNKAQVKEIAERIRNSQWQTWEIEKEQNRKDAIFELDKAKLQIEVKQWAAEQNIKLKIAEIELIGDLVGYVCNFATAAMGNVTELQKTDKYIETKKELANKPKTTHTQNYSIDKKGNKKVHSGKYSKTE